MTLPREVRYSKTRGRAVPAVVRQQCLELIGKYHTLLGYPKAMPTISFDLRGKHYAQTIIEDNHIRINGEALNKDTLCFKSTVLAHEFSHLAAHDRYGRSIQKHGLEWQDCMTRLGASEYKHFTQVVNKKQTPPKSTTHNIVIQATPPAKRLPVSDTLWQYALKKTKRLSIVLHPSFQHDKHALITLLDQISKDKK